MSKQSKTKTPAYQIEPASCKGAMNFEECFAQAASGELKGLVAEEKLDGLRYLLQFKPNGAKTNFMTSRRISKVTGEYVEKQDKVPFIRDFSGWTDTIMDGEFISEGISSDTQHALANGKGEFVVWDLLRYNGQSIISAPLTARRQMLEGLKSQFPPWLQLAPQCRQISRALRFVMSKGGEGLVLKDLNCIYGAGWIKVKGVQSADCVIVGYEMSTEGKYMQNGWIKNILLGQYVETSKWGDSWSAQAKIDGKMYSLVDVGKTSGMDERTREYITNNQKKLLGVPVEVKFQFRLPSGKFRHPRFIRFRHDKNPHHCIYTP